MYPICHFFSASICSLDLTQRCNEEEICYRKNTSRFGKQWEHLHSASPARLPFKAFHSLLSSTFCHTFSLYIHSKAPAFRHSQSFVSTNRSINLWGAEKLKPGCTDEHGLTYPDQCTLV